MVTEAGSTRIGPYEILREIGRGGMGVVFFARDLRLDRDVAVKALPELLARHPERLARFQREARLLASLNHPNIAAIYGLEEIDGRCYLVLEYVDGETLEEVLRRRGALPIEDALQIALQIARAVEAAHEKAVIHRDLKPANIKFTSGGDVKVLDFGLAKAMDPTASIAGEMASPRSGDAITQPPPEGGSVATIPGLVLGSPGYLSPEQARGQPADRRTDVFSFGCLLYEKLTGTSLFAGQSIGDSIGATLYKDPDWNLLPADTPPTIRLMLRRCLQKDPRKRLHDMADARLDLEEAIADPTGSMLNLSAGAYASPKRWWGRMMPVAAGLGLLAAGAAAGWFGGQWSAKPLTPEPRQVVRFSIESEGLQLITSMDSSLNHLAVTPDGSMIAFMTSVAGESRLMLREVATGLSREIVPARGGTGPFFSPDGRWLGFVQEGRLMKVSVQGGPASPITSGVAPIGRIAWLANGRIVLTSAGGQRLYWTTQEGAPLTLLAESERGKPGVEQSQSPILGFAGAFAMGDGRSVLVPIWNGDSLDDYELTIVDTETGRVRRLLPHATAAAMIGQDTLVFLRNSTLLAARFDPQQMSLIGEPMPVTQGIIAESWAADGQFAISSSGTLVYAPGGRICEGRQLVRLDSQGEMTPIHAPDAFVGELAVSPDGRYVTVSTLRRKLELWVFDLQRSTMTLINNDGESYDPVWSPDGKELAFVVEGRDPAIVRKQVFSTLPRQIVARGLDAYPTDWHEDTLLVNQRAEQANGSDIVAIDLTPGEEARAVPLIATGVDEYSAVISPEGKWMLYASEISGQSEVYLGAYPFDGRTWQISLGGGYEPMWASDTKAYFVSTDNELFSFEIRPGTGVDPEISTPVRLFSLRPQIATSAWGALAPLPDGSFIGLAGAEWERSEPHLEVVINWGEQIAERLEQPSKP